MTKPWEETGWWANACAVWEADGDMVGGVNINGDYAAERAVLMAAAPDLYRALSNAMGAMREVSLWRISNAISEAAAALRMARGE